MLVMKKFKKGEGHPHYITSYWLGQGQENRPMAAKDILRYTTAIKNKLEDKAWYKANDYKEGSSPVAAFAYDAIAIVWEPDQNELGEIAP